MKKSFFAIAVLTGTIAVNAASPYISRVYEFCPAPGQFVNDVPEVPNGSSPIECASEQLVGEANPGLVSLGAFGGYVVFGFDHPVVNSPGEADFTVYGNTLMTQAEKKIATSEPGIVWVSKDVNNNGLPDDQWYELIGSESDFTERGLTVTYTRPSASHKPVEDPDRKFIIDAEYIKWECSDGTSGWIQKNTSHTQDYWPSWIEDDKLVFTASRLPDNAEDTNGKGTSFTSYMYDWGYADNRPNSTPDGLNIGNAVDKNGNPVHLDCIHFVKVQTAVRQNLGWLGESSTEIAGAEDLHPDMPLPSGVGEVFGESPDIKTVDLMGRPCVPVSGVPFIDCASRKVTVIRFQSN